MNIDTEGAAADLRRLADEIEKTRDLGHFETKFRLETLHDENELSRLVKGISVWEKEITGSRYLYSFVATDTELAKLCQKAMVNARARKIDNRRFSRVNGDGQVTRCLYVGSSKSLATRIRQHFGLAYRGTYAMQMMHWQAATPLLGTVRFQATRFPSTTNASVLQALEDKLWMNERPLFGRMGAR